MKEEIDLVMEEHFDLKSVLKIPILEAKITKLEYSGILEKTLLVPSRSNYNYDNES